MPSPIRIARSEGRIRMVRNRGQNDVEPDVGAARLTSRPSTRLERLEPGEHRLGLNRYRDAILFVPRSYRPEASAPFVLSLHGAGGNEIGGTYPLRAIAENVGLIMLSPASRKQTWDVIVDKYGPDVD